MEMVGEVKDGQGRWVEAWWLAGDEWKRLMKRGWGDNDDDDAVWGGIELFVFSEGFFSPKRMLEMATQGKN